jgi:3-oxoacyl-[acyl-carrier protein] reductase
VAAIATAGGSASAVALDVCRRESVDTAMAAVLERHGRLDGLVNNAGITRDNLLLRMKAEEWEAVLATNLTGVYHCTQARPAAHAQAAQRPHRQRDFGRRHHRQRRPGELRGQQGGSDRVHEVGRARGRLAHHHRERDRPGFIDTEMTAAMTDKARETVASSIPMGRVGKPEDVAGAALFLLSDAAAYVTGQVLGVDGGFHM